MHGRDIHLTYSSFTTVKDEDCTSLHKPATGEVGVVQVALNSMLSSLIVGREIL